MDVKTSVRISITRCLENMDDQNKQGNVDEIKPMLSSPDHQLFLWGVLSDKTTLPPTISGLNRPIAWLPNFQRARWCTRTASWFQSWCRSRGTCWRLIRIRNDTKKTTHFTSFRFTPRCSRYSYLNHGMAKEDNIIDAEDQTNAV